MGSTKDHVRVGTSANDANAGLRVRLSGQALPDPLPVEAELRRLVLQRLDPAPKGR